MTVRHLHTQLGRPVWIKACAVPLHAQMKATFEALAREHGGRLTKAQAVELLQQGSSNANGGSEAAELLWAEMGLAEDAFITEVSLACACCCRQLACGPCKCSSSLNLHMQPYHTQVMRYWTATRPVRLPVQARGLSDARCAYCTGCT